MQPQFQFIPKLLIGGEIRALCWPLKFLHSDLGRPCFHGVSFVHIVQIVLLEQSEPLGSSEGKLPHAKNILDSSEVPAS